MDLKNIKDEQLVSDVQKNLDMVLHENVMLADSIDYNQFASLIESIGQAKSIFLIASGRSGFSMRSAAMRLMHLGLKAYFVGDTTTPAIQPGDLLLAASG
ncbi:MAG: hypothetical protein JWR54_3346, partial [Mucilaginibacter sp.]|nr:hypothetical protein [Mucilaginibacter sp.]